MRCSSWTKVGGIILICIGLILAFTWNIMYDYFLEQEMVFSPDSKVFEMWKNPTVPITMNVYLFNYTNPEQLTQGNYTPNIVEMGPYSFKEVHEKVNITWNDNNTVTYKQVKRWYFDPENSKGSLKDNVTMLNVLPVAATYVSRYWSNLLVYPLAVALRMVERTVWITKTVGEHLFDGYTDPLLSIATSLPGFGMMDLPADRIGFFYGRNGSADHEGAFNMDTGANDSTRLGILKNWNYSNTSNYYEDECSHLDGSAGDFFPRKLTKTSKWSMFAPDICKTVSFEYLEDAEVNGVPGYKFVPTKKLFDNGTQYSEAKCNCRGECLPSGVLNISTCRHGAPGFVSYPHFLGADPYYMNSVNGLKPDPEKHSFEVILEPRTGIPLDVRARFQVNLFLQPIQRISMFENMPVLMSPVMWFEDRATLPSELATSLKIVLSLSTAGIYFAIAIILLGALLFLTAVLHDFLWRRKSHVTKTILRKCPSITEDVPNKNGLPTIRVHCQHGADEQNSLLNRL